MSNPSNRLRASLEDYYIIELNDPISNVNFYSYGNHSLLHGLNTYIKKYGGYTKKNKEIKKNKKTKTKKNNEIKKK